MSRASNKPNTLRRLLGDSSGASALEFSLVLFPFVLLLVGSMELGRYYFTAQNLRTVVAEAGRHAAIDSTFGTGGCGCSNGSGKTLDSTELAKAAQRTPFLNINDLTICVQNGSGPGDVTISIRAIYPFSSPFPFISHLNGDLGQQSQLKLRRL